MSEHQSFSIRRLRALYASRFEPENMRALAAISWEAILAAAFLGVVLACSYGVWEFFGVVHDLNAGPGPGSTPPVALNRENLEKLLAQMQERQKQLDAIRSQTPAPDPSK